MDKVIVRWYDIDKTINDDDFNSELEPEKRLAIKETIGFLYTHNDKVVLLVQEFSNSLPIDYVTIPIGVIIDITYLKRRKQ
jgi:hypothetical protein